MIRFHQASVLWVAAILAPIHGYGEASQPAPESSSPSAALLGEDLFKWGEYDSLIRVLEPATAGTGAEGATRTAADSAVRAKSFLFLGVAFYATGKRERADSAFGRACELDPLVKLDRYYVTEEIANHFQAIALDGIRNRKRRSGPIGTSQAKEARAAADSAGAVAAVTESKPSGRADPGIREGQGKGWLWWGLGMTALAATGGGLYYINSQNDPPRVPPKNLTTIDAR